MNRWACSCPLLAGACWCCHRPCPSPVPARDPSHKAAWHLCFERTVNLGLWTGSMRCQLGFSTENDPWPPLVGGVGTAFQTTPKYLLKVLSDLWIQTTCSSVFIPKLNSHKYENILCSTDGYTARISGTLQYQPHLVFLWQKAWKVVFSRFGYSNWISLC